MESRLVVVSGGGTGIGRAIAARFAEQGDDVVILGRRPGPLAETAKAINTAAGVERVRTCRADLTELDQVRAAVEWITADDRPVDVVVNNAGGNLAPFADAVRPESLERLRADWETNLTGNVLPAVLLTTALLPALRRPGSRIVTVTSIAAFRGPSTYGGAKAALHSWSADLAIRLAAEGVTVNVVAPGYIPDTEFYGDRMNPAFHRGRAAQIPMGHGGEPAEVAAAVAYLADTRSSFVTGQILQINGGALLGRG